MALLEKLKYGGITHNGTFHADDVLSTCLLKLLNSDFTYTRTSNIPKDFKGIVYDVGGGEYDHHTEIKKRSNGKNFAAFGLLWKDFSSYFMDRENAELFDEVFVSEIDRCDTTSNSNLLSSSIEYFNPKWNSETESDAAFDYAVKAFLPLLESIINHFKQSTFIPRYCRTLQEDIVFAFENISKKYNHRKSVARYSNSIEAWKNVYQDMFQNEENELFITTFLGQISKTYGKYKTSPIVLGLSLMPRKKKIFLLEDIIENRIESINALVPAAEECRRTYNNSDIKELLIFEKYVPNNYLTQNCNNVKAIVFPSERGGYNILALDMNEKEKISNGINKNTNVKRFYFPEEIRGQDVYSLGQYSKGLLFVHQSGFLATCETLEDCMAFFNKAKK